MDAWKESLFYRPTLNLISKPGPVTMYWLVIVFNYGQVLGWLSNLHQLLKMVRWYGCMDNIQNLAP